MADITSSSKDQGFLYFSLFLSSYLLVKHYVKAAHYEDAYWGERRGRARVEKEMKKLTEIQLNTQDGFFVQPIGTIHSCYRQCVGTPRQGALVPSSRASIVFSRNMSPEALDGLHEFSHVWITFKFHLNTNTLKEAKAFNGTVVDSKKYTFTAKITPPMLKEKKGVLATRSPHRPNPIGVTLARIESVNKQKNTIYLNACDLVEGTPVLDVKPYVPCYDSVEPCRYPQWIAETIDTRNAVSIEEGVPAQIQSLSKHLKQYKNDPEMFLEAITQTLQAEVRSKFQTKRRMQDAQRNQPVEVPFDEVFVKYFWQEDRALRIIEVTKLSTERNIEKVQLEELEEQVEGTSAV